MTDRDCLITLAAAVHKMVVVPGVLHDDQGGCAVASDVLIIDRTSHRRLLDAYAALPYLLRLNIEAGLAG